VLLDAAEERRRLAVEQRLPEAALVARRRPVALVELRPSEERVQVPAEPVEQAAAR